MVQGVQSSEDLLHSRDLEVVSQELLHLPGPGQLLLDLLGAGQVVVDGGRLDGQAPLHHQPGVPLSLAGILDRKLSAPHVDHPNLNTVYQQPLVLCQRSSASQVRQSSPNDEHLRALRPDLELVEPLVADVVGDVLNKKQDCSPEYSFFTLAD